MSLADAIRAALADLTAIAPRFAVVGGFAVAMYDYERFTRDADFAVAVESDAEAEAIVDELLRSGYRVAMTLDQTDTGRLATVRMNSRADAEVMIDLLFASCGIEPEIVRDARMRALLPGAKAAIAERGHLIAMKLLSTSPRRPNDSADLHHLAMGASDDDWQRARRGCELIIERGFSRGRDLLSALEELTASVAAE